MELQYENVFFDLDGTLTDSKDGIIHSIAYALVKFGQPEPEEASLSRFVGPPLLTELQAAYGFSPEFAWQVVQEYRRRLAEIGLIENRVYEGVPEMLQSLRDMGKRLYITTSKPEVFALQVVEHFALAPYFDGVFASSLSGDRATKGQVIAYAMQQIGLSSPDSVVLAGDRKHDVLGAKENGMDCIGVLYGYGSKEELLAAGAKYLADTPAAIADFFTE